MRKGARRPRVALVTLGCAKNLADSDLLAGQIIHEGIAITPEPGDADAIIVNTCAFLTASQKESVEAILSLCEQKRPGSRLVVAGCLAQRHGDALLQEIPEIDLLVGPGEVHSLAARLRPLIDGGIESGPRVELGGMDRVTEKWDLRVVSAGSHSAYVKISEGCDRTCSFCVIPAIRGRHRSRSRESIGREVRQLAASGVAEFNLVAQELTAYGIDRSGQPLLSELLKDLDRIPGVRWIRLLYAHPATWTDDLTECVRDLPRVCRYVDIPIQHVAEGVLRRMNRPGPSRTRRLLDKLRKRIPGVAIRTTLLTGFPGETETDFEELLAFVEAFRFDHLGVFAFSPENGTRAAGMQGGLPARVREERRRRLMAAQRKVSAEANRSRVGERKTLLIDSAGPGGGWIARHEGQAPEVDGVTKLEARGERILGPGQFCDAIIRSAGVYDLRARVLPKEEIE
jgi:ribosomal protein S12 methylthiotransferase